jgi:hypothetical protein
MSTTTGAGSSKRTPALSEHPESTQRKRQKKNDDATIAVPEVRIPNVMEIKTKNAHLKGRKRFVADLEDVKQASKQGFAVSGLTVKRTSPVSISAQRITS